MAAQNPDTYGPNTLVPRADNAEVPGAFAAQQFKRIGGFDFTVAAEATDVISVTIQAKDVRNRKWNGRIIFDVIISTSTFGAPDASFDDLAVTTGVLITEGQSDSVLTVQSDADGKAVIAMTKAGAYTVYMRARCGDRLVQYSSGSPLAAAAITWAA